MVWPIDDNKVHDELQASFSHVINGTAHANHYADYVRVGVFLGNSGQIRSALAMLEDRLEEKLLGRLNWKEKLGNWIAQRNAPAIKSNAIGHAQSHFGDWDKRIDQKKPKKYKAASHLLTDVLCEIEDGASFGLFQDENGHPKAEMILALSGPQFRQQLKEARPFKDPTVGPDHGEFTHRVQWALLTLSGVLRNPVAQVYQKIGEIADEQNKFGLWDAICDRIPKGATGLQPSFTFWKEADVDFRCPEALLSWLCKDEQQKSYPLLAGFLKARKEKRWHQFENDLLGESYLAAKVYNSTYDRLSDPQKDKIAEWLTGGLVVDDQAAAKHDPHGLMRPSGGGYDLG